MPGVAARCTAIRLTAAMALATTLSAAQPVPRVRAWQDTLTLPTYLEGPPDPNPPFSLFDSSGASQYPYTMRPNIGSSERKNVPWRSLNLENEYLFCRVLPDLGGHLYS